MYVSNGIPSRIGRAAGIRRLIACESCESFPSINADYNTRLWVLVREIRQIRVGGQGSKARGGRVLVIMQHNGAQHAWTAVKILGRYKSPDDPTKGFRRIIRYYSFGEEKKNNNNNWLRCYIVAYGTYRIVIKGEGWRRRRHCGTSSARAHNARIVGRIVGVAGNPLPPVPTRPARSSPAGSKIIISVIFSGCCPRPFITGVAISFSMAFISFLLSFFFFYSWIRFAR